MVQINEREYSQCYEAYNLILVAEAILRERETLQTQPPGQSNIPREVCKRFTRAATIMTIMSTSKKGYWNGTSNLLLGKILRVGRCGDKVALHKGG